MSELSSSDESEGYDACDDAVDVGDDGYIAQFFVFHSRLSPLRGKTTHKIKCGGRRSGKISKLSQINIIYRDCKFCNGGMAENAGFLGFFFGCIDRKDLIG